MPNPRDVVAFDGIQPDRLTFKTDNSTIVYDSTKAGGSAGVGLAVSLSAAGTVQLTNDNDTVIGKLVLVESDNKAHVHVGGIVKFPGGNAATLTLGSRIIGALGAASARGYVKSVPAAGATYAQADAANADKGRGVILDASDTTNVVVWLK